MNQTARDSWWVRRCGETTPRDRRNQRRYLLALFAWAVAYGVATFLIVRDVVPPGPLAWLLAAVPSAVAVLAVLAYVRFLREADELQRAIELQSLALAVAVGFVIWPAFRLLGLLEISLGAWADLPILLMIGAYVAGTLVSRGRYQ